jgi:hypothetical protein
MQNNSNDKNKNYTSDPSSPNYDKRIKNKANEETPFAEEEPSNHTEYK